MAEGVGTQSIAGHWSPVEVPADTKIEVDGMSFDALLGRVGAGAARDGRRRDAGGGQTVR